MIMRYAPCISANLRNVPPSISELLMQLTDPIISQRQRPDATNILKVFMEREQCHMLPDNVNIRASDAHMRVSQCVN